MTDLPEPLKNRVNQAGWVPIEFIGRGGGAKVYLSANVDQISAIDKLMRGRGAISDSSTNTWVAGDILKCLATGLILKKDALVALKVPLKAEDPTAFMRLKREIQAMTAIQHPSLIRLFGVDDKDPPEWFAMEWHPNGDLSKYVDNYKGHVIKTLQAILPIVEALASIHEKGFVHRDIKPSNIFVSAQDRLVLGDFGIVFPTEAGDRLTEPSTTLISRDWYPDWGRFTDSSPQPKFDVFMVAKVIYWMVTGGQKVLATQIDDEAFDLRYRLKEIEGAAELQEVLAKCITAKEVQCQFANARELLAQLQDLLAQLTGKAQGNLLLSFLSVHPTTHVPVQKKYITENFRYPSLTRLQIFLANPCKKLQARARLIGPPRNTPFRLFLEVDKRPLPIPEGFPFEATLHPDQGTWVPILSVNYSVPLPSGWHDLGITIISDFDSCSVTGFILYGG